MLSWKPNWLVRLNLARTFNSFTQKLKNFDGFPSHTVYIDAIRTTGIIMLHKGINNVLKTFTKDIKGTINPHVTIAYKDLGKKYGEIMGAYKKKIFKTDFIVNKFSLLKHDGAMEGDKGI